VLARVGAVALVAVVAVGVTASAAAAHATLVSSSPAQSAVYPSGAPPTEVSIVFDEAVTATPSSIRLYDGRGHPIGVDEKSVTSKRLDAKLPRVADGGFVVVWHVVSGDGHPEQGAFTFSVGKGGVTTADIGGLLASRSSGRGIGIGFGVDRMLAFIACLVFVGGLVFVRWFWPEALARSRSRRALLIFGGVAIVATLLSIPFEAMYTTGGGYSHLFDGSAVGDVLNARFGTATLARAALLLALMPLVVAFVGRMRSASRFTIEAVVAVLALAVSATFAYGGHGDTGRFVVLGFATDMAHLGSAAIWLGGIVALVIAMEEHQHTTANAVAASRFSKVGLVAVGVLVVTGVTQGWRQIGTWSALWHTDYGRLLVVKVLVVVAIVVVASASRDVLRDRIVPRLRGAVGRGAADSPIEEHSMVQLRNSIWAEVILAVFVLGVTAALVVTAPGREADAVANRPVARTLHFDAASRRVRYLVAVQPAIPGQNTIVVTPRLIAGQTGFLPTSLTARVDRSGKSPSAPVTFTPLDDGRWVTTATLSSPGTWRVELTGSAPSTIDPASVDIRIG
jgi:copper transport protein